MGSGSSAVRICFYLAKDDGTVVLDGADTCHLDGGLDRTGEQETTERALVSEQVKVRLGLVFVLVSDRLADLVVLGNNPRIGLISMSVEFRQSAKTLFVLSVVDEPSTQSQCVLAAQDDIVTDLGDSGKNMIRAARITAGTIWTPRLIRHCLSLVAGKLM